ncbi:predicted protein [Sclerotinia sclerotiorum 1980 UF-70]|uniref:Uncharacterized protein n=1 Tax=Sclerotinia sclerotiorum (strain ATCC 18683 / 1980 / Ss-1) TaxID=665079 RepID=A7EYU8_SCLS1|nr:predicted protein [Sclerotinia sclerotiorum 1980 UF-70]EDN94640.1 predicted protein [Sclerotinia sclerotiorum 1980 UF-70]
MMGKREPKEYINVLSKRWSWYAISASGPIQPNSKKLMHALSCPLPMRQWRCNAKTNTKTLSAPLNTK